MVGTAVYQVGRASSIQPKNFSALNPGVQNTPPPRDSGARMPAISPWMWNSGMMFRPRSASVSSSVVAILPAEAATLRWRQRHDLRPRGGARCVQDQRDVLAARRARAGGWRFRAAREHEGACATVRIERQREHRYAELLRDRDRGRFAAGLDDERLGVEVAHVELELVGLDKPGSAAQQSRPMRWQRTPSPSPGRWAGQWRRGRCGRCRDRSALRPYRRRACGRHRRSIPARLAR